jgi:CubicO group peptidase (beta-lactamase class C family)
MKRLGWKIASGLALSLVAAGLLGASAGGAAVRGTGKVASRIDRLLSEAYPAAEPGAAVLVSKAGTVILKRGYGLADTDRRVPASPETVFRLASVTKVFTSTAVLMLVERGALALDDPVTKLLPTYPASGRTITVRHLLSHSAGLADYLDRPNSMEWASRDYTVQDLIDAFKDRPSSFSPGQKNAYSNSNYVLLGAIIEKVSGLAFGRFGEMSVFGPLGMKSTSCGGVLKDVPRLATAYEPARTAGDQLDWSRLVVARPYTFSSVYAAGGCVSSVEDMAKFHDTLRKGMLVGRPFLETSFRPVVLSGGGTGTMSEGGWQLDAIDGHRAAMRLGALPGACTCFLTIPDEDVAVILLSNRSPGKPRCGALAVQIAGLVVGG